MNNLAGLLEESANQHPDRAAIVFDDERLSYAQVNAAANQVANLLTARNVGRGDRVALSCPNLPYFSVIYNGILKCGAVVVPLNILLTATEVAYHLNDAQAKAYFAFEGDADLPIGQVAWEGFNLSEPTTEFFLIAEDPIAELRIQGAQRFDTEVAQQSTLFSSVDVDADDTAVILYTSGTTGQPKGAELRHRNMRSNALLGAELFRASADAPDVFLCALPLYHSFGQTSVQNIAFAFGGVVVMMDRFDPRHALALMAKEQVSIFSGVPTMFWALLGALDSDVDVKSIASQWRIATSGGAALPLAIHTEFKERFGITIAEGYGLSETSPIATFLPYGEEVRPGSIGKAVPGVELKLIDDDWNEIEAADAIGEIAIRGQNVMRGYFNRPEATADAIRDGWFRSGDLARVDSDGFYFIVDRAKDMIIRGGFNVYPREVEEVMMQHPAISLVAVTGIPDEKHGEEVRAFVILNEGMSIAEDQLINWCKERLAKYKYPRSIRFRTELPMTSTGKLLKRGLV